MARSGPRRQQRLARDRDERRRRAYEQLPAEGPEEVPELSETYTVVIDGKKRPRKYLEKTRQAWEAWWSSPMATQWDAADLPTLLRMLQMTEQFWRGDLNSTDKAELRRLEERFGVAGPGSRQKLNWELPSEDDEPEEEPDEGDSVDDERRARVLRVVSDAG